MYRTEYCDFMKCTFESSNSKDKDIKITGKDKIPNLLKNERIW